jgi:cation:H+ antiporter
MMDYLLIAAGLSLLIAGGELLVRGAATTAERLGMSPLLIGLTLVGFGTSAPELVTSVEASLANSPGIAVGNVVGSNIANILLILGISALIAPMAVSQQALKRDGVVMFLATLIFVAIGQFALPLDRLAGAVLLAGLATYLCYAYMQEKAGARDGHTAAFEKREAHDELAVTPSDTATSVAERSSHGMAGIAMPLTMALGGLAIVVLGGKLLVEGAIGLARHAGLSETLIGLTIVAIGTSLPELVTSVIAAIRKHSDVAIGNIIGSNIYNILGIGGATSLLAPTTIPAQIVNFDALVMLSATIALLVIARTGYRIGRLEGVVLLAGYGLYVYMIWPAGVA